MAPMSTSTTVTHAAVVWPWFRGGDATGRWATSAGRSGDVSPMRGAFREVVESLSNTGSSISADRGSGRVVTWGPHRG